jgi:hypothetical protein
MIYSTTEWTDDDVTCEKSLIGIGTLPTISEYKENRTTSQQQTASVFRRNYDLKNKLTDCENQIVQFTSNKQIMLNGYYGTHRHSAELLLVVVTADIMLSGY